MNLCAPSQHFMRCGEADPKQCDRVGYNLLGNLRVGDPTKIVSSQPKVSETRNLYL